jgi:hypothetical protein
MRSAASLAVLLALASARAFAATASNGAEVLRLPMSARAAAMGGALTADGGGLDSLGFNPAGVASAKSPELMISVMNGLVEDNFGSLGYAHPPKYGVAYAGMAYYDAGPVTIFNLDGSQQTVVAERDYVGMAGWAMPLGGGLSVGATGKAYKLTLAQSASAAGFAGDAGARWATPLKGFSLGAAVQNMGPNVKFEAASDPLPLTMRGGAEWTLELHPSPEAGMFYTGTRMTLIADAIQVRNEALAAAAGGEFSVDIGVLTTITVRIGNLFDSQSDGGLSFGLGLREGRFTGDYALNARGALGNAQTISLGVHF